MQPANRQHAGCIQPAYGRTLAEPALQIYGRRQAATAWMQLAYAHMQATYDHSLNVDAGLSVVDALH